MVARYQFIIDERPVFAIRERFFRSVLEAMEREVDPETLESPLPVPTLRTAMR